VMDLTLDHPMSFDFHISFHWPRLGPFLSPFRDVRLHLAYSDHSRWPMHSYNHIIVRQLPCASDFTYTNFSFDWVESFNKLKRALTCILFRHFIWATPSVSKYFHFYQDCARLLDKLLRALVGFDEWQLVSEMEWLMLCGPPQHHLSGALV